MQHANPSRLQQDPMLKRGQGFMLCHVLCSSEGMALADRARLMPGTAGTAGGMI